MNDDVAIKVQGITKTFKDQASATTLKHSFIELGRKIVGKPSKNKKSGYTALKDINFEVKKGEFFGIVGRNGSGKSTLLKIIAGVYNPSAGKVSINGKLTPFIELGVGFNQELSGKDNVYLNAALLGFTRKEIDEMYEDIVDFAELNGFMSTKLKNYSSGMQVRLAFSVAIRAESEILLIDEVLAVGDVAFQNKCLKYFEKLKNDTNKTIVFISHDMDAIRRYCNRAIMINEGSVYSSEDLNEVIDAYIELNTEKISDDKPFGVDDHESSIQKLSNVLIKDISVRHISRKKYVITQTIEAIDYVDEIVPGVVIRNQNGQRITSTNTKWDNVLISNINKGSIIEIRYIFNNVLEAGLYFVSANVVDKSLSNFLDWKNDAASFIVKRDFYTGGVAIPEHEIKVKINY